jgi:hypothetical protein
MRNWELGKINVLWFLTLGVTAVASAIVVYLLLLESILGAFRIEDASPALIGQDNRPRVALLNSEYTRHVHRVVSPGDTSTAWVDQTLLDWRKYLIDFKPQVAFTDISDGVLETGRLDNYDVLILPSARALSDLQIARIQDFMNGGGSVFATWQPGIYREDGSWRGWSFVEETFGVEFQGFVDRGSWNYRVYADTFPGFTPPGIYVPRQLTASGQTALGGDGERNTLSRYRDLQRAQAAEADFAPLRDYVWYDSLGGIRPRSDFAIANPTVARIRNLDGQERLQDAMAVSFFRWTGFDPAYEIPYPETPEGIRRLTLPAGTPLTAGMPPGYRLKVQVYNQGVKVRVTEPNRTKVAGYWYDFATDFLSGDDNHSNSAGLLYGRYGQGRFVWTGTQREALGVGQSDREDAEITARLFSNAVTYLLRKAMIWLQPWPDGNDGAMVISTTLAKPRDADDVSRIADLLQEEGVRATYFVDPDRVPSRPDLIRRLRRIGEVGLLDTLIQNGDGPPSAQIQRLARKKRLLELVTGEEIRGYRSTRRGGLGEHTLEGLQSVGITYFLADSVGRRISPWIYGGDYSSLTRIGATQYSDRDIERRLQGSSADFMAALLEASLDRIAADRGTFNLQVDPEIMGQTDNLSVLRSLITEARVRNFWITEADSLIGWWRLKRAVNVTVDQRSPTRLYVNVSNDNGFRAEEVTLSIALGHQVTGVDIQSELFNILRPQAKDVGRPPYRLVDNGNVLELTIKNLKPQQYRIYHIDLFRSNTDASAQVTAP